MCRSSRPSTRCPPARTGGQATPTRASRPTAGAPDLPGDRPESGTRPTLFGFVQLEYGVLLGPPDGRYLVRSDPNGPVEAVLVLGTIGAPERRLLRGRRARPLESAQPEPVPISRATVVRSDAFQSREEAAGWLAGLRIDDEAVEAELDGALGILNRALRAQRAATADPYVAEVSVARALVARVGYGRGEAVAEGRFGEALELPRIGARRFKRSLEAPEERFAALLGARERALAAEELVLRARADLNAGRLREAALQSRVALEALIAELGEKGSAGLAEHRAAVGEAANVALRGELAEQNAAVIASVAGAMETALRRHRLSR